MKSRIIVLTLRDGTEEIFNKFYIKRVRQDKESGYTKVIVHGSGQTPDYEVKVQESIEEVLKLLFP